MATDMTPGGAVQSGLYGIENHQISQWAANGLPEWGISVETGQLLSDAITLMVLGMGTVYVFLTILVFVTATMSALVKKYSPAPVTAQRVTGPSAPPEDTTLLAVIAAAIHAHRTRK
jgi:oxaloacetate decarboxylase gamma subunit